MNRAKASGSSARLERPAPILIHDGIVVPGALCEDLAAAVDLLCAFMRGTPPPPSQKTSRLSPAALAIVLAARDAALRYRQLQESLRTSCAAVSPAEIRVLAPAIAAGPSASEITTEQAAALVGITESRVRQLAAAGVIGGRKTDRNVWLLSAPDVRAYRDARTRSRRVSQARHPSGGSPGARTGDRPSAAGAALSA